MKKLVLTSLFAISFCGAASHKVPSKYKLTDAIEKNDIEVVRNLINQGVELNPETDLFSLPLVTASHLYIKTGKPYMPLIKLLLEEGADPYLESPFRSSPNSNRRIKMSAFNYFKKEVSILDFQIKNKQRLLNLFKQYSDPSHNIKGE